MAGSNEKKRLIRVFIASPGDLAVERRGFKDTIDALNAGFGRGADVEFEPLGWEDALSQVGRRSQAVINADVDACDVFVLVMWRRWGQEAPDAAERGFSSYTEEEFFRALSRFEKSGEPTLFVFFKHIDPGQMADAGPQLAQVLAFRRKLEQTRKVLYRPFKDEPTFKDEIDRHLVAFARGEIAPSTDERRVPLLPDSALAEIERAKADAKAALERAEKAEREAEDAKERAAAVERAARAGAEKAALALAERAAKAGMEGKIEEARQDFAAALDATANLHVLNLGAKFYYRIGELDETARLLRRWLAISGPDAQTADTAAAYGNLATIHLTRSEVDQAERMYRKVLTIHEKLNHLVGIATDYGHLGLIHQQRGEPDEAERMHRKSLDINEKLGRLEGMAAGYGNLATIQRERGDLDEAERMDRKSLAIEEQLGRLEGVARVYGNLGLIQCDRGDLDEAERMHRKALDINQKLSHLEGMGRDYCNLGVIQQARGELDEAERMHRKSLEIEEKLGRLEGMANAYGNLGLIHRARGELDEAERMFRKSLGINEKLGRLEGMAVQYANLGSLQEQRGDLGGARELWTKARDLYARIGMPQMVTKLQGWLDDLDPPSAEDGEEKGSGKKRGQVD